MIEPFSELPLFFKREKIEGCFVDTSVLFSASFPLDSFNSEAEFAFEALNQYRVPVFTNVNVRAEFLENHRRVLIPECLIDFLEDFEPRLDGLLMEKLKAHRTAYRRKVKEEKSNKFDVNQIRSFRRLLSEFSAADTSGWEIFCRSYLNDKMLAIWKNLDNQLGLNFISLRSDDRSPFLNSSPEWEQAVSLMGRYGIASSDAMILNMFLCSKIPALLTADQEMAECALQESKSVKSIFLPNSLLSSAR